MGEAKDKKIARSKYLAYRKTIPSRIFKTVINAILFIPVAIFIVLKDSYDKDKFIWQ